MGGGPHRARGQAQHDGIISHVQPIRHATIDRKGKRMRPSPELKLVVRDRNHVAPKATGGFATARAVAGVLAVSGRQQKATPDSGKSAHPRAERSPRSPIVHHRHLKFGAVSSVRFR